MNHELQGRPVDSGSGETNMWLGSYNRNRAVTPTTLSDKGHTSEGTARWKMRRRRRGGAVGS